METTSTGVDTDDAGERFNSIARRLLPSGAATAAEDVVTRAEQDREGYLCASPQI